MIGYLIIGIASVAMFGVLAATVAGSASSFADGSGRIETARRLDQVVQVLTEDVRNNGGPLGTAPAGEDSPEGYRLPRSLGVPTSTPFGAEFRYCPFGVEVAGSGHMVTDPGGASYEVRVEGGRVVGGRPAFARVAADPRLIGFVTAPLGRLESAPPCASVRYREATGAFEISGGAGLVRPVFRPQDQELAHLRAMEGAIIYAAPAGDPMSVGLQATEWTTFASAWSRVLARETPSVEIHLAMGVHQVEAGLLAGPAQPVAMRPGGVIRLVGSFDGVNFAQILVPEGTVLRMPADMVLVNISAPNVTLLVPDGRRVEIHNSILAGVIVDGGSAEAIDSRFLGRPGNQPTILVSGGSFRVATPSWVGAPAGSASHLVWVADGGTFEVEPGSVLHLFAHAGGGVAGGSLVNGIRVDPGGTIYTKWDSRTEVHSPITTEVIRIHGGVLQWLGTNLILRASPRDIIRVEAGGVMRTFGGSIGSLGAVRATRYGILDAGARLIGGHGSVGKPVDGLCWVSAVDVVPAEPGRRPPEVAADMGDFGGVFVESQPGVVGRLSSPPVVIPVSGTSSSPTAAEVRAYAHVLQQNARRIAVQQINHSLFQCVA